MKTTAAFVMALSLAAVAAPASAGQFIVTYTGTVSSFQDDLHLFGLADGEDLEGQDFSAVLTFDDTLAPIKFHGATQSLAYGGGFVGGPAIGSAVFTAGGTSITIGGIQGSTVRHFNGFGTPQYLIKHEMLDYISSLVFEMSSDTLNFPNLDYSAPFDFEVPLELSALGRYERHGDFGSDTLLQLEVRHLTITPSAAPEPASWALMILGFGTTGLMLRTRRRPARFA